MCCAAIGGEKISAADRIKASLGLNGEETDVFFCKWGNKHLSSEP